MEVRTYSGVLWISMPSPAKKSDSRNFTMPGLSTYSTTMSTYPSSSVSHAKAFSVGRTAPRTANPWRSASEGGLGCGEGQGLERKA